METKQTRPLWLHRLLTGLRILFDHGLSELICDRLRHVGTRFQVQDLNVSDSYGFFLG